MTEEESYTCSEPDICPLMDPWKPDCFVVRYWFDRRGEHIGTEYLHPDGRWRASVEFIAGTMEDAEVEWDGTLTGIFPTREEAKIALELADAIYGRRIPAAEAIPERQAA